jgi:hypothetical protein
MSLPRPLFVVATARSAAQPAGASTWRGMGVGSLGATTAPSIEKTGTWKVSGGPETRPDEISWTPCASGRQAPPLASAVCASRLQIFFRGTSATSSTASGLPCHSGMVIS